MPFQRRTFTQILQDMVDHVRFNTTLTDYRIGAVIRTILEAAALEDDEIYFQAALLLADFSFTTARGPDLGRRLADFDLEREEARPALGQVVITLPAPAAVPTVLAAPIRVYNDASPQYPHVDFVTTLDGLVPAGALSSAPIPIVATRAGADTNIPAGLVNFLAAPIPGLAGATVTNPISCAGGRDAETDDELRARGRRHIRALPRGTVSALEGKVLGVRAFSPATGELVGQVASAALREERPGESTLFVLDVTNRFAAATETLVPPGEMVLQSASLGQRHVKTSRFPVVPQAFRLEIQVPGIAVPLVLDSVDPATAGHFDLDDTTGVVTFRVLPTSWSPDPAIPAADYSFKDPLSGFPAPGLPAGSRVRASYAFFTGVIAAVQQVLNGLESNRALFPGWKAAGTRVRTRFPVVREIGVLMSITPMEGFSRDDLRPQVASVVEQYINGRKLGEEVVHARLIDVAMDTAGVHDVTVFLPTGNVLVLEDEIARAPRGSVVVT